MRWQLSGPWPVGSQCLPAGSIISDGEGWPMPPPLNARALDEDAAMALFMAYDEAATIGGWHQLHFHPSIDRAAVFAQARHNKRWPNGEPDNGRATSRSESREATRVPRKRKKEEKPGLSSRRLRGANSDVSNSNEVVWTSGEIICEGKPTHPRTGPRTAQ